ncbi:MAG: XRE family transcriptional regulator [Treponema sp.]|jgi:transcriptional regulator with XRE-family HTH domain|nr:XRE family transcriptional regulator [Treponema sp.]
MEAETFWANVNQLIKEQKTTQETLASDIGTPFGTFRGWNFYNRLPDAVSAYRIAQALNTSVECLVTGKDPSKPDTAPLVAHAQALLDGLKKL